MKVELTSAVSVGLSVGLLMGMWMFQMDLRSVWVQVPEFIISMECTAGLHWSGLGLDSV